MNMDIREKIENLKRKSAEHQDAKGELIRAIIDKLEPSPTGVVGDVLYYGFWKLSNRRLIETANEYR